MKTEISIPNALFKIANQMAKELGVSLGELYTLALRDYIEHQEKDITAQLDEIYAEENSSLDSELMTMQVASIGGEDW